MDELSYGATVEFEKYIMIGSLLCKMFQLYTGKQKLTEL
jgi:hypothetical protein